MDCDGAVSNGCEVPIHTLDHCGSCDATCAIAFAKESCSERRAARSCKCDDGRADCDDDLANGCETNLLLARRLRHVRPRLPRAAERAQRRLHERGDVRVRVQSRLRRLRRQARERLRGRRRERAELRRLRQRLHQAAERGVVELRRHAVHEPDVQARLRRLRRHRRQRLRARARHADRLRRVQQAVRARRTPAASCNAGTCQLTELRQRLRRLQRQGRRRLRGLAQRAPRTAAAAPTTATKACTATTASARAPKPQCGAEHVECCDNRCVDTYSVCSLWPCPIPGTARTLDRELRLLRRVLSGRSARRGVLLRPRLATRARAQSRRRIAQNRTTSKFRRAAMPYWSPWRRTRSRKRRGTASPVASGSKRCWAAAGWAPCTACSDARSGKQLALKRGYARDPRKAEQAQGAARARVPHAGAARASVDHRGLRLRRRRAAARTTRWSCSTAPTSTSAGACRGARSCALLCDVASSLAILHSRGLLHRDVSSRNVRCTADGRAKLIDFGAMAQHGRGQGSASARRRSCAPEALQMQQLDARADLFSLGALGYYLLTGAPRVSGARRLSRAARLWRSTPARAGAHRAATCRRRCRR